MILSDSRLWSYFNGFLSLAYPNICNGCDNALRNNEEILCPRCIVNLPRTGFELSEENPAFHSFWGRVSVDYAASMFYYRKGELIQKLIHLLKYRGRRDIGLFLGRLTGRLIKDSPFFKKPDFIVPVPLHPRKLRARGYNQSDILAKGISEEINVSVLNNMLVRDIYNPTQTRKTRFERWGNVSGIFSVVNPESFENINILLVDDVITTGSTLEACCQALSQIKGVTICVVTVGYSAI